MSTEWFGKSTIAPGPKVVISWLWRICPCGRFTPALRFILVLLDLNAVQGPKPKVYAWLNIAHRTIRTEFFEAGRLSLQFRVQELV
jgi:hypothetical protein